MSSVQNANEWKMHMAAGRMAFEEGDFDEASLAADDLDLATDLSNPAAHYHRLGDIRKRNLGSRHAEVAESMNNLTSLYCSTNRCEEAEPLYAISTLMSSLPLGLTATSRAIPGHSVSYRQQYSPSPCGF